MQGSFVILLTTMLVILVAPPSGLGRGGVLPGKLLTQEGFRRNQGIQTFDSEMNWLLWHHIHPTKDSSWQNLKDRPRAEYRNNLMCSIRALWQRGAQNDLLRVIQAVSELEGMTQEFMHEPWAHIEDEPEPKAVEKKDGQAGRDYAQILEFLFDHPGDMTFQPPSSHADRLSSPLGDEAIAGLGARTISYPLDTIATIRDRLHRRYRWGSHYCHDTWDETLQDLTKALGARSDVFRFLGRVAIHCATLNEDLIIDGEHHLFAARNRYFRRVWPTSNARDAIDGAIDLLAAAEAFQAGRSATGPTTTGPGVNLLEGLSLRIGGCARYFIERPSPLNLAILGAIGIVGTRSFL